MTAWTEQELDVIGRADELRLAARRHDATLRPAVTIWVVRVGADLYVRTYRGVGGAAWYRAAVATRAGRVETGKVARDVAFEPVTDTAVNDRVDAAYWAKYDRYGPGYTDAMTADAARQTTLRLAAR